MTLILGILLFLFFILIGIIFICSIGMEEELKNKEFLLITPILGSLLMVCFGETLFLILPMKYTIYIFLVILILLGIKNKEKVLFVLKIWKDMKLYLFISILSGVILSIPSLKNFSLNSPRIINNDIAFYLSSMDWLLDNSFLNFKTLLSINPNQPYYSLATFMIRETRIGLDVVGSQIMGLLFLKPHQVFYSLGIAISSVLTMTSGFLLGFVLKVRKKINLLSMVIIATSLGIFELQRMQYIPQLFGIAGMILFLGILINIMNDRCKNSIILLGLALAGTLSVYAEFSSILVIYFLSVCIIIFFSSKERKKNLNKIYTVIVGCILSFILSPLGMYKAIKFNLVILNQASQKVSNIDPFEGNLISSSLYFPNVLGFLIRSDGFHNIRINFKNFETWQRIVFGISFMYLILGILIVLFILLKKLNKNNILFITILSFFILYAIYFRKSKFAYGEYKFLLGVVPVIFIIFSYFIQQFFDFFKENNKRIVLKVIFIELISLFVILNISNILFLSRQPYFFYDNYLMELRKIGEKIPKGRIIDIPGTGNEVHAGVYALKNNIVRIKGFSYYSDFFSPEKLAVTKKNYFSGTLNEMKNIKMSENDYYLIIKENDTLSDIIKVKENIYWENKKYRLIQKSNAIDNIKVSFGKGIDIVEIDNHNNPFRWTISKNSEILIENESTEDLYIKLKFKIEGINNTKKSIEISLNNNKLIGKGNKVNEISTIYFKILANKKEKIIIKNLEPLTKVKNDSRELGIKLREIELVDEKR